MKKMTYTAIASVCMALAAGPVSAMEYLDIHGPGMDEGLSAGALPPPGLYSSLNNYNFSLNQYDDSGHKTGVKIDGQVDVISFLWQTGIKVLGADYAVALVQPFNYVNVKVPNDAALSDNGHWGRFNTVLVPGILSWSLPHDFHVKTSLAITADNPSSSLAHPPSNGGAPSGNGFWSLTPEFGVSWLHSGWNLSMDSFYSYNFEDRDTDYKSGQELQIDYTATKTIGKWTVGLGATQTTQLTNDSGVGAEEANCSALDGCKARIFEAGPLLGYQFDGIHIMAEYNHDLYTKNDVGGNIFNLRFSIPVSL